MCNLKHLNPNQILKISGLSIIAILILLNNFFPRTATGQTPNQVINSVNSRFAKVDNYKADVTISCNIPFIKVDPIQAKVFYRKPDKFKVKSTGILILPKQNANFILVSLADTNGYTAVQTSEEVIGAAKTKVINIIPNTDTSDLVLGKFWIDDLKGLVLKSQLTTKSQGTILIESTYGSDVSYGLPEKMNFIVDVGKFKIPKAVTADINHGSSQNQNNGKGTITLVFSNYKINEGVSDEELK